VKTVALATPEEMRARLKRRGQLKGRQSEDAALQDVRDRVAAVQAGFPRDVKPLQMARWNNDNSEPVVQMALLSPSQALGCCHESLPVS
jgi:hypothetical protein